MSGPHPQAFSPRTARPLSRREIEALGAPRETRTALDLHAWRRAREPEPRRRVIMIGHTRGGVGKTTLAVHLAAELALRGWKTLLADLDPSAGSTRWAGIRPEDEQVQHTILDVLLDTTPLQSAVVQPLADTPLDLLPSDAPLCQADVALGPKVGRDLLLRRMLRRQADDYDYIVLDLPSGWGVLHSMSTAAAHMILVPCIAEPIAVQSVSDLTAYIAEVVDAYDLREPDVLLVPNGINRSIAIHAQCLDRMRAGDIPIARDAGGEIAVPQDAAIKRASGTGNLLTRTGARAASALARIAMLVEATP